MAKDLADVVHSLSFLFAACPFTSPWQLSYFQPQSSTLFSMISCYLNLAAMRIFGSLLPLTLFYSQKIENQVSGLSQFSNSMNHRVVTSRIITIIGFTGIFITFLQFTIIQTGKLFLIVKVSCAFISTLSFKVLILSAIACNC